MKRANSGQGIAAVAKDLGRLEQTPRNWVKAAKGLDESQGELLGQFGTTGV